MFSLGTGMIGLLAPDLAGAVELRARLDHELFHEQFSGHLAAGYDFEPFALDQTGKLAAYHDPLGANFTVSAPLLTDRYFSFGLDRPLDPAINMKTVGQGKVADQLCPSCNDGRPGTLAVRRITSANDSHSTRSSLVNKTS